MPSTTASRMPSPAFRPSSMPSPLSGRRMSRQPTSRERSTNMRITDPMARCIPRRRRRIGFLKLAGALLAVIAVALVRMVTCSPAGADNTVTLNNPPTFAGETAQQCYHDANEHLVRGMWYERAAAQLKEAIRQEPRNPDYHLALGCAYADRAASIGYAASYAAMHNDEVAQYPKELDDWEKGQSDPTNYEYHTDRPLPPPAFVAYTKDDLKLYTLTSAQTSSQLQELAKQAEAEWTKAIALCPDRKARASAEYVQGWGLSLLSGYRNGAVDYESGAQSPALSGMPTQDDAAKAFEAAVKDDPGNAVYWQSLGDALGPPDTRAPDPSEGFAGDQLDPKTHGI